jgi:biopolymer transport protein ExbB
MIVDGLLDYAEIVNRYLRGGGLIMAPLMAVSVLMWVLIINRTLFFRRLYRKNISREKAGQYVSSGTAPDPATYQGAISLLVREFLRRRTGSAEIDRQILDETVMVIVSSMERYLATISVLAKIAPLLGLLGTVTGMVATFDIIAMFGTGNARALAGGISEALITTQTGLLIAIPGLYMSNFLNRRAENLKSRVASVGMYLHRFI